MLLDLLTCYMLELNVCKCKVAFEWHHKTQNYTSDLELLSKITSPKLNYTYVIMSYTLLVEKDILYDLTNLFAIASVSPLGMPMSCILHY